MDPTVYAEIRQIINRLKQVGVPFYASPPTLNSPVYTNCTDSFYFDWAMNPHTPVMMDECFSERLGNNSDDEFECDFIGGLHPCFAIPVSDKIGPQPYWDI
jgi:hypothetical protein